MLYKSRFLKTHGLGNDFVIVKKVELSNEVDHTVFAKKIADRYFGNECDQFIIYEQHRELYNMFIFNQNGSQAKVCGNSARCLAKLIFLNTKDSCITMKAGDESKRPYTGRIGLFERHKINLNKTT